MTKPKTEPPFDIHAREEAILGKPPRIAPLGENEVDMQAREVVLEVVRAIGRKPPEQMTAHTAIMLRHAGLYRRHTELGLQLYMGALPPRLRELAVLRLAWLAQAPYEWGEHVDVGKRVGGLTSDEIERVTQGSTALGWNDADRAILQAVEELFDNAMLTDATWKMLEQHLDERQLIELPILVGQYLGVAYLQNSLRIPLLPGNAGLGAR